MDLPPIIAPDAAARRAAEARIAEFAVPFGALGRYAGLACWLAAVQGVCPPRPLSRPRVLAVAADHGIAAAGVSAYRGAVTLRQVEAARKATMPITVAAPVVGASVRVVDVGLDHEPAPADERYRVRRSSGRIDVEDALTGDEVERGIEIGRALADEEADAGADLLLPVSFGVGATTPASVIVAALTGTEPVAVIGRGSGIDDAGWMRKAAAVRDARRRAVGHVRDPLALLRAVGGADLAVLTGLLIQAAARRTPVLLDGLVVGAAAMLANELVPVARGWWLVAQRGSEPAMKLVISHVGLEFSLDKVASLGDGTGALLLIPGMRMAAHLLAETSTAADSGITPAR